MAICAVRSIGATFEALAVHVMLSRAPVALSCALEINRKFIAMTLCGNIDAESYKPNWKGQDEDP